MRKLNEAEELELWRRRLAGADDGELCCTSPGHAGRRWLLRHRRRTHLGDRRGLVDPVDHQRLLEHVDGGGLEAVGVQRAAATRGVAVGGHRQLETGPRLRRCWGSRSPTGASSWRTGRCRLQGPLHAGLVELVGAAAPCLVGQLAGESSRFCKQARVEAFTAAT